MSERVIDPGTEYGWRTGVTKLIQRPRCNITPNRCNIAAKILGVILHRVDPISQSMY